MSDTSRIPIGADKLGESHRRERLARSGPVDHDRLQSSSANRVTAGASVPIRGDWGIPVAQESTWDPCARDCCLPGTFAARDKNRRLWLISQNVVGFFARVLPRSQPGGV
jgi:hypothetical protein